MRRILSFSRFALLVLSLGFMCLCLGAGFANAQDAELPLPDESLMPPNLPVQFQLWEAESLAVQMGPFSPGLPAALDDLGVPWQQISGEIHLMIESFGPDSLTPISQGLVLSLGGTIGFSIDNGMICTIPITRLSELAYSLPDGAYLRMQNTVAEDYQVSAQAVPAGNDTMGLFVTQALAYQRAGMTGSGIKVGIIDGGFSGLAALQASGDAPPAGATTTLDMVGGVGGGIATGSQHGAACLEILYDFAPDASYYLYKINSPMQVEGAVNDAISKGVDILSMSMSWYNTAWRDGRGFSARGADNFASQGKLFFCSSGNQAQEHLQRVFKDTNANHWHDMPDGTEDIRIDLRRVIAANPGGSVRFYLQWDDVPTDGSGKADYDLYLYRWEPTINRYKLVRQAATKNILTAGGEVEHVQYEELSFANTGAADSSYYLGVWRRKGPVVRFEVTSRASGGVWATVRDSTSSSGQPSNALQARVVPVAAIDYRCYRNPVMAGCSAADTTRPREVFSCLGNTNGGLGSPTLSGPDRISTQTYGVNGFSGTSCSTPAIAGVAALLKSGKPALTHQTILTQMNQWAAAFRDHPPAGKDSLYGHGAVMLPEVRIWANYSVIPRVLIVNATGVTRTKVALFGAATMDVANIAHNTVVLNPGGIAQAIAVSIGDLNGDGKSDALYTFDLPDTFPRGAQTLILRGDFTGNGLAWGGSYDLTVKVAGTADVTPLASRFGLAAVQPNPSPGSFQALCRLRGAEPAQLEVFDVAGRLVHRQRLAAGSEGTREVFVNLRVGLAAGAYRVRLTQGRDVATMPLALLR